MAEEIVWTNPNDGRLGITIPSIGVVFVPADAVSDENGYLDPSLFVEFYAEIPGVNVDIVIPAVPAGTMFSEMPEQIIPALYRPATAKEIAVKDMPHVYAKHDIAPEDHPEYHIVDREKTMNMDNYFRDAWVHDEGDVEVHPDKAVAVHIQRLREQRAELFPALDMEQKRALVAGDTVKVQEIEVKLQALRDLPDHPEITKAKTLEELKFAAVDVLEEVKNG